jgi:hypothetical protein
LSFVLRKEEKLMVGIILAGAFSVALSQSLISNAIPVIMSDFIIYLQV